MPPFATHAASTIALLLGLGALLLTEPASAQRTPAALAAPCPGPTQITQTAWNAPAIGLGGGKNPALGQSFTAPCTGFVHSLSFYVYLHPVMGPIDVTVYEGAGRTGPVLAATTVDITSDGWKAVSLSAPVPVTDGEVYTFVLTVPPGQNTDIALYTSSANPYAGGVEYHALFGPFQAFPSDDLMFTVDLDATAVSAEPSAEGAGEPALTAVASPNPVATRATVTLTVARTQAVTVAAYDALGRRVAVLHDGPLAAGAHALALDAAALPPGVYVVRATAEEATAIRRVTVVR